MKTRMMFAVAAFVLILSGLCAGGEADAELLAGVARASITPLEKGIPTQLGGYGARAGKPAEGIHDTIWAKALVLEWEGAKSALITLDVCSAPQCLLAESLQKASVAGLTPGNTLMAASHTHAGLEGFSMDRRNVANNPHIGIFSEDILNFVSDRVAEAVKAADAALRPVRAGSGVVSIPNANANRRGDSFIDPDLTLLRLDDAQGKPYVVLVNFTAHGTIMTEKEMLISGCWAGNMQRTVEALMGEGVTCMYTNGAEGDIRPINARGGSRWEMAEDYGRRIGIQAVRLADTIKTQPVRTFDVRSAVVQLPARKAAPDFMKIAGDEYKVDPQMLDTLLGAMFPGEAPLYALRVDDFELVSFPAEPICQLGLALKASMRSHGIKCPCVASLTSEQIGYVLTAEEYQQSGYEVTASFYGEGLGQLMLDEATKLAVAVAEEGKKAAAAK